MKTYTTDALPLQGRNAAGPAPLRERVWHVVRALQAAASEYGLKERHLTVLDMLGSFLQETGPEGRPIVFASNLAMSERARGMDVQRIQRVMRDLIEKQFVIRRSSPNGKRYVRRDASGQIRSAFGIDLSPLLDREKEFLDARDRALARQLHRKMLRDELSLIRMSFTPESEEDIRIRALLRNRNASLELMESLIGELTSEDAYSTSHDVRGAAVEPDMDPVERCDAVTEEGSGDAIPTCDAHRNDTHQQRVIQNNIDKKALRLQRREPERTQARADSLDFHEIARACPRAMAYTPESPRNWLEMVRYATEMAPNIGIPDALWRKALEQLGGPSFSAAILCMVERVEPGLIRNPAGYLTKLISKGSDFCATRFLRSTKRVGAVAA
ncbi:plasmid replication protein RepC [Paracoccus sp. ME4]|uniref:plasmid replication protein RepC n=1 Tax=Paracoccus sp. ME4 TaxID=3138066 RepID=UPI00398A5B55